MTAETPALPPACQAALAALEQDPLTLSPETSAHLRACPACAEARVLWLAQEESAPALAPAGYFERLPGRISAKLPARTSPRSIRPWLWAAAAVLLMAGLAGGFLAGRANRQPLVEASVQPGALPHEDIREQPFREQDEVLVEAEGLTAEQLQSVVDKLSEKKQ